jgi:hypothetical protein
MYVTNSPTWCQDKYMRAGPVWPPSLHAFPSRHTSCSHLHTERRVLHSHWLYRQKDSICRAGNAAKYVEMQEHKAECCWATRCVESSHGGNYWSHCTRLWECQAVCVHTYLQTFIEIGVAGKHRHIYLANAWSKRYLYVTECLTYVNLCIVNA